jgi:hypothetical protein
MNGQWLTIALACWCISAGLAGGATFTATLDRDTVTLGENATLSLSFVGGTPRTVPSPQDIPNLQIDFSGYSQEITTINGQFSATVSYTFTITPRQPGDYTIPALTAEVGAEQLHTQPLKLKVLKPSAPPPDAIKSGSQPAFLKLLLPKKEIYVGETIVAQLQIYLQNGVSVPPGGWQETSFPAEGFNVSKQIQGQQHQVQIGNAVYVMVPLSMALTAVKAGAMTLGPYSATVTMDVPTTNRQRNRLDPFGMFNMAERKQVVLATDPENVQLLPLPRENAPPDFNGAVGEYTLSVSAGPTNVAVGDPITVRIQIAGRGSLDSLTLPNQPAWNQFSTYPPTSRVDTSDKLGLQGTKTFEQIVVPQNADVKALPPVAFSYFDPQQKGYRTLTQPAVPLVVRPAGSAAAPTFVANSRQAQDNTPTTQDIVPNKQRLGAVAQIGPPLAQQPWFLALQGVPVLAFLSAVIWRKRTDQLANNPRLRRRRHVSEVVREGLVQMQQLAAANQSDEFFAALFRLLQEQLGERLDLPASAITEAVIEERLRPHGVPEDTLKELEELFQACNLARYAPVKSSQELAAMIPKLEGVLRRIQALNV